MATDILDDNTGRSGAERELSIEVRSRAYIDWRGTRAQLVAEGLIPPGFRWPERTERATWSAAGFHFNLRRRQPTGDKKASWATTADDWALRREMPGQLINAGCIYEKARALGDELLRHTPAWNAQRERHWHAVSDADFQSFLAAIIVPKKQRRGRKPR